METVNKIIQRAQEEIEQVINTLDNELRAVSEFSALKFDEAIDMLLKVKDQIINAQKICFYNTKLNAYADLVESWEELDEIAKNSKDAMQFCGMYLDDSSEYYCAVFKSNDKYYCVEI